MTQIITVSNIAARTTPHRVYLKQTWNDVWTLQENLWCDWLVWSAAPTIPSAGFSRDFGHVLPIGKSSWTTLWPLNFADWFVKVEVDQSNDAEDPLVWYGILTEDARNLAGAMPSSGTWIPTGQQTLVAYGLEMLLERATVDRTIAEVYGESGDGAYWIVPYGQVFNARNHLADKGNRSRDQKGGSYLFAEVLDHATHWSTYDIVEHLLRWGVSLDAAMEPVIAWELAEEAPEVLPAWDQPILETHGRTVKTLLDALLDRRRLFSYYLGVDEGSGRILVHPFTFLEEELDCGGGEDNVIYANTDQISLDFDLSLDINQASVRRSTSHCYEQVQVVGQKVVCCGTISAKDGTLVAHWDHTLQTEYEKGASLESDYPQDDSLKVEWNRRVREAPHLARVFAWFGLPTSWNEKVKDGANGSANYLFPYEDFDLDPDAIAAFYQPTRRFLAHLPLKSDHDYSESKIEDEAVVNNTPSGQPWAYMPFQVYLKVPLDEGHKLPDGKTEGYVDATKAGGYADLELLGYGAGFTPTISVGLEQVGPGLVVKVQQGDQHAIAKNDFAPLSVDYYAKECAYDWKDNLVATIAMEADYQLSVKVPEDVEDPLRILRIDARDLAQAHYVAPGTVVGIKKGQLLRTTSGGWIRDDTELLTSLANTAWAWYGVERQTLTLSYQQAIDVCWLGQLVTKIGQEQTEEAIRSVITQVRLDLGRQGNEPHRTTIETQWGELDVLRLYGLGRRDRQLSATYQ